MTEPTPQTEAPPSIEPRANDLTGILAGSCVRERENSVAITAWRVHRGTPMQTTVNVALSSAGARLFAKQLSEWADHVDKLNAEEPPARMLMRWIATAAKDGWHAAEQSPPKPDTAAAPEGAAAGPTEDPPKHWTRRRTVITRKRKPKAKKHR